MNKDENIATTVNKSKTTNVDMVNLKCLECGDTVAIPMETYNNKIGNKNWKGEWIRYTPQELEKKYSPEELKQIGSMTERERNFYLFKIVTPNSAYCSLKCNSLFTDD